MRAQPRDMVMRDVGEPDCVFTGEEVLRMRAPMVYLWARGADVLYVGMSGVGLARPLTTSHEYLRDMQPGDQLRIWRSEDPAALEDALLYHLRPQLNRRQAVYCPTCASFVGQSQSCLERTHAPDPSFCVPGVRTNVARRPDHAVRTLRNTLCPETPTGAILPNPLPPEVLACPTPEQVDHRGDVAVSRVGRNQSLAADAGGQVIARDAKVRLLLRTAIEAATDAKELLNPGEDPSR